MLLLTNAALAATTFGILKHLEILNMIPNNLAFLPNGLIFLVLGFLTAYSVLNTFSQTLYPVDWTSTL